MHYIIDANNLAGKLGILFNADFEKRLIGLIKNFSKNKNIYYLIFDSNDFMGDKYADDNIFIIYAPRDSYYASADDKIIETINDLISNHKVEVNLITDDLEIITKTKAISADNRERYFRLIRATDFAKKLLASENESREDDKNLDLSKINSINQDLLKLWS